MGHGSSTALLGLMWAHGTPEPSATISGVCLCKHIVCRLLAMHLRRNGAWRRLTGHRRWSRRRSRRRIYRRGDAL